MIEYQMCLQVEVTISVV